MVDFAKILNSCSPDPAKAGNTLLILNAAGMVFAALSNTFAAATDKNTSAEDKKFLVPAGLATGVANLAAYFAVTKKIIDNLQGVKQIEKDGKIVKKGIKGAADFAIESLKKQDKFDIIAQSIAKNEVKKAGKFSLNNIGKDKALLQRTAQETLFGVDGNITDAARQLCSDKIKAGAGVLGAFAGAVIGCAIITPIIRDISAYFIQKKMEKNNPNLKQEAPKPYFDPAHVKVTSPRRISTMNEFMVSTRGRMRI